MSSRKWLILIIACAVILPAMAVLAWLVWSWNATRSVETLVADLKVRKLPTTIAELEWEAPEEENAAPILAKAFELAESIPSLSDDEWELTEVPASVRKQLPLYAEVFELLYRAAEKPRCRFPFAGDNLLLYRPEHYGSIRELASLLAARAVVREEEGKPDGALEDLRVLFMLSRALRDEPGLSGHLLRIAVAAVGLEVLRIILPRCPSAVDALRKVAPDAARGSILRGMQGELVMAVSIAVDPHVMLDLKDKMNASTPYVKLDAVHLARVIARFVEIAREPYPAALPLAETAGSNAAREGGVVSAILLPAIHGPLTTEARHASSVELVRLGAACLDYRREHGEYPATLNDLPDVPLDPLTGRPFVLEVTERGIRIRSEAAVPGEGELFEIAWELE